MNPFDQFKEFYNEAESQVGRESLNSMCLSTVDCKGFPHSRMVLFKGIVENQFTFFTNFKSNKAKDISVNPNVAILFYWKEIKKQVRIEGIASKAPREFVEKYWDSRPFDSQVSGAVSEQSQVIPLYKDLVERFEKMRGTLTKVICPEHWGGYFITPHYFEFWEGSPIRLHKRLAVSKNEDEWESKTLAP